MKEMCETRHIKETVNMNVEEDKIRQEDKTGQEDKIRQEEQEYASITKTMRYRIGGK